MSLPFRHWECCSKISSGHRAWKIVRKYFHHISPFQKALSQELNAFRIQISDVAARRNIPDSGLKPIWLNNHQTKSMTYLNNSAVHLNILLTTQGSTESGGRVYLSHSCGFSIGLIYGTTIKVSTHSPPFNYFQLFSCVTEIIVC